MAVTLRRHLEAVASCPHNTDYPEALETCARTIEEILAALGYAPQNQVENGSRAGSKLLSRASSLKGGVSSAENCGAPDEAPDEVITSDQPPAGPFDLLPPLTGLRSRGRTDRSPRFGVKAGG